MRIASVLLASVFLLLASCGDESTSSKDDSAYPAHRPISASLRAKCPDMNAARGVGDTSPSLQLEPNETRHITYGIYDSAGALVAQGAQENPAMQTSGPPVILWNGKDAAGNTVPTGLYFVFLDVYDQAGTLLQSSSYCIGFRTAS